MKQCKMECAKNLAGVVSPCAHLPRKASGLFIFTLQAAKSMPVLLNFSTNQYIYKVLGESQKSAWPIPFTFTFVALGSSPIGLPR